MLLQYMMMHNLVLLGFLLMKKKMQIRTRNRVKVAALPDVPYSSWSTLYENGDDEDFISILGINRSGFKRLLKGFARHYAYNCSKKGGRRPIIDQAQALGLLLQFYASTLEYKTLAQLLSQLLEWSLKMRSRP